MSAEFVRVSELVGTLLGRTEVQAREALQSERLNVKTEPKCDTAVHGTVVGGEVSEDASMVVLQVSKNRLEVPVVYGTDTEEMARDELKAACYVPEVKYYYTTERAGTVVAQDPSPGETPASDNRVTLYVSEEVTGQTDVDDALGSLSNIGDGNDANFIWSFGRPFAIEGRLFIPMKAAFDAEMSWRDPNGSGSGYGTAVIVDEFNKEVPVEVLYGKQSLRSRELQYFTASVPLGDLNDMTPTKVFLYLYAIVEGNDDTVRAEFTLTW